MNWGLRLLLISLLLIGCASTPKPVAKKKATPAAAAVAPKTAKGPAAVKGVPAKAPGSAPAKAVPAPTVPAAPVEEEPEEEEEDDQFARIKKYYKK